MKDLSKSVVIVLALALVMGLLFRWMYPLVEMSSELAGLFVFVALLLKGLVTLVNSQLRKGGASPPEAEAGK